MTTASVDFQCESFRVISVAKRNMQHTSNFTSIERSIVCTNVNPKCFFHFLEEIWQWRIQTLSVWGGAWFFVTCPAGFSTFHNSFQHGHKMEWNVIFWFNQTQREWCSMAMCTDRVVLFLLNIKGRSAQQPKWQCGNPSRAYPFYWSMRCLGVFCPPPPMCFNRLTP